MGGRFAASGAPVRDMLKISRKTRTIMTRVDFSMILFRPGQRRTLERWWDEKFIQSSSGCKFFHLMHLATVYW